MLEIKKIVDEVSKSRKYRNLCADTITRVAQKESLKSKKEKEIIKSTKNKLHQIYGAYTSKTNFDLSLSMLENNLSNPEKFREACKQILNMHKSTKERVPILDDFYKKIFQITGNPKSVLDLACGLNPLSLPWMELDPKAEYIGYDIDKTQIDFLNKFLSLCHPAGKAKMHDIISNPPQEKSDVAFLLKTVTCLERQEAGIASKIIEILKSKYVVVSFPTRSISGKSSLGFYEEYFNEHLKQKNWLLEKLEFPTELVFVIEKETAEQG